MLWPKMHGKKSWLFDTKNHVKSDKPLEFVNAMIKTLALQVLQEHRVILALMVKLEVLANLATKVLPVFTVANTQHQAKFPAKSVHQVPKAHQAHLDPQDQLESKAFQAKMVHPVKMVPQARAVHQAQLVNQAKTEIQDLKDHQVEMVKAAPKASQDRKDPQVQQALKDQQDHQAPMANSVDQDQRDHQAQKANLENLDPKDHQVQLENQAAQARMPNIVHAPNVLLPNTRNWLKFFLANMILYL